MNINFRESSDTPLRKFTQDWLLYANQSLRLENVKTIKDIKINHTVRKVSHIDERGNVTEKRRRVVFLSTDKGELNGKYRSARQAARERAVAMIARKYYVSAIATCRQSMAEAARAACPEFFTTQIGDNNA